LPVTGTAVGDPGAGTTAGGLATASRTDGRQPGSCQVRQKNQIALLVRIAKQWRRYYVLVE
jgi:hypothetical protein